MGPNMDAAIHQAMLRTMNASTKATSIYSYQFNQLMNMMTDFKREMGEMRREIGGIKEDVNELRRFNSWHKWINRCILYLLFIFSLIFISNDNKRTFQCVHVNSLFVICLAFNFMIPYVLIIFDICLEAISKGIYRCSLNGRAIELHDVLYVKNLRHNLLSVSKLDKKGFHILFGDSKVLIMKDKNVIATGYLIGDLYKLTFDLPESNYQANYVSLHRKLGHLNMNSVKELPKCVDGVCVSEKLDENYKCEVCSLAKMTTLPYNQRVEKRSSAPLQLIHTDMCGPVKLVSRNGEEYFITFTDDYTAFKMVYLMKHKSEAFQLFVDYVRLVTARFNRKVCTVRCDRGGEYTSKNFRDFCRREGIYIQYTGPYASPLNGVSERCNRSIEERARAMLLDSKLPKTFWGDAVKAACYVLNRSPTASLKDKVTPAEMFYGTKPNVSKIHVFGCVAYGLIPKQFRSKFDQTALRCIFIGYAENGYLLWDPVSNKVRVIRNVRFDENRNYETFGSPVVSIDITADKVEQIENNEKFLAEESQGQSAGDLSVSNNDQNSVVLRRRV